ncbi:MAG: penicillin-binding transpeptidase domain-containing protein [Clostridium sp.]|uniref:penicillin-binding transpeptidase domain-containing protein n=1 Tax=Clostridium sp. TaxID=1506 RepID=UPI0039E9D771
MINDKKKKKIFNRYTVLIVIMIIAFSAIGTQLFNLQINMGTYYSEVANTKSHKLIPQEGPRGTITDKNGIKLATNVQSYEVTFIDTEDSKDQFFYTISKVFKILDDNNEKQDDSFALKVNPYRFEFNTNDPKAIQTLQLRFLKDRGFQDSILKTEFKGKKETDLTVAETSKLNSELLKLTPEQVFNALIDDKTYGVVSGVSKIDSKYTVDELRRYLLIKDAIKMNSFSGYKPVPIASNIKKNTALILWQKLSDLSGINVDIQPMRSYPYGTLASSVLGYISKINSTDQQKYAEKGYDVSNDYIGTSGIEAYYESRLRGSNGGDVAQIDKQGRITNNLASREASPGQNIQLTIDANVQYATEQALQKEMTTLQQKGQVQDLNTRNATRGAAIVIDTHNGGILSLASLPGFDPNDFSNPTGLTEEQLKKYFNPDYVQMAKANGKPQDLIDFMFPVDSSIKGNTTIRKDKYDYFPKPLYNYATMPLIPSGSTFKPLTAIAGLQSGVINATSTVNDQAIYYGDDINHPYVFKTEPANGIVDVVRAITVSSNPYFMEVGKRLKDAQGDDALAKYAWQFGLGADPKDANPGTGIEIPENFGQVYNIVSQRNINATQFLLNIEQDLSNGSGTKGEKFQSIDLYDRPDDSKDVLGIKAQIKNSIKDTIKSGISSTEFYSKTKNYINLYTPMYKQLIAIDPKYNGKNYSDANVNAAVTDTINQMASAIGDLNPKAHYHIEFASIGQGMNAFTPLQLAGYVSTLANGGTRYKLHLFDRIVDADGKIVSEFKPEVLNKIDINAANRDLVMKGMGQVTGGAGADGTAAGALGDFNNYIKTAGKTGTAQGNTDVQDKIGRSDYAWFIGYAPADNPQIAVAVVIFDGGYGSQAAYVAKGIYESYFKDQLTKLNYKFDAPTDLPPPDASKVSVNK